MDYVLPRDCGLPRIERDQSTRFPPPPASRGGGVPRLSAESKIFPADLDPNKAPSIDRSRGLSRNG